MSVLSFSRASSMAAFTALFMNFHTLAFRCRGKPHRPRIPRHSGPRSGPYRTVASALSHAVVETITFRSLGFVRFIDVGGVVEGVGDGVDDVAGDHADHPVLVTRDIAGKAVQVDP